MKLKRIGIMLAVLLFGVAIPIWAAVHTGDDEAIEIRRPIAQPDGEQGLLVTWDMYGYGSVDGYVNGERVVNGGRYPAGTEFTLRAKGLNQDGFEFIEWIINSMPYHGEPNQTLVFTIQYDTHFRAVFDHPWSATPTPQPSDYAEVATVVATADNRGTVHVSIPGHAQYAEMETWSTESTMEFWISPPPHMYFGDNTDFVFSENITVTFGPIVQFDGRLSFTILALPPNSGNQGGNNGSGDDDPISGHNNNSQSSYTFMVLFELEYGIMPPYIPLEQSLAGGSVIEQLPTPTRQGYTFTGWALNGGGNATVPLTVNGDIVLSARWTANTADQFVVVFNPAPGSFPNANESGLRPGYAGTVIANMPQDPTRSGYTFGGWRLPNGNVHAGQMTISADMVLTAIWNPSGTPGPSSSSGPGPSSSSSPGPSSSSSPGPSSSSSPGPSSSSSPGPSSSSSPGPSSSSAPSSSPAPSSSSQPGSRPNPNTSPLQVSFMIFGGVIMAGIAAVGITKLAKKQLAAQDQYRSDVTRFNREERIANMLDDND